MDRQAHDYGAASAMAFAQQQRQQQQQQPFGYPPQQQFHGPSPPFLPPPHPSLQQQFPYHHHLQQQPQQVHPHPPPQHSHLLHLQQQQQPSSAFPPHLPPPLGPSPFHGFYDAANPAPPPSAPPSDPELHKRIDKLVEYSAKNGPEFEAMIREKQQDNPEYSFLFGGEGHGYYRYKLWLSTRPPGGSFNPPPFAPSSLHMMRPPPNPMLSPSPLNAPPLGSSAAAMMGGPQMHQPPYFYEQQHQHPQSFGVYGRPDYDQSSKHFKGLSGSLPSDVAMEFNNDR